MHVKTQLLIYLGAICLAVCIGIMGFFIGFGSHKKDMTSVVETNALLQVIRNEEISLLHFLSGNFSAATVYKSEHAKMESPSMAMAGMDMSGNDMSMTSAELKPFFSREQALYTELVDQEKFFDRYTNAHSSSITSFKRISLLLERARVALNGDTTRIATIRGIESLFGEQEVLMKERYGGAVGIAPDIVDAFKEKNDLSVEELKGLSSAEVRRLMLQYPAFAVYLGLFDTVVEQMEANALPQDVGLVRAEADGDRPLTPSEKTANLLTNYRLALQQQSVKGNPVPPAYVFEGESTKKTLLEFYVESIKEAQSIRENVETQVALENWYNTVFSPKFTSLKNELDIEQNTVVGVMHTSTSGVFWVFGITGVFVAGIAILFALLVLRGIISPLVRAKDVASEIARGNMDVAIDTSSSNELGDLSRALDRMRVSLKAVMQEYERKNIAAAEKISDSYQETPKG